MIFFLNVYSYFFVNYFHFYISHPAGVYFYTLCTVGDKLCIFPDRGLLCQNLLLSEPLFSHVN